MSHVLCLVAAYINLAVGARCGEAERRRSWLLPVEGGSGRGLLVQRPAFLCSARGEHRPGSAWEGDVGLSVL